MNLVQKVIILIFIIFITNTISSKSFALTLIEEINIAGSNNILSFTEENNKCIDINMIIFINNLVKQQNNINLSNNKIIKDNIETSTISNNINTTSNILLQKTNISLFEPLVPSDYRTKDYTVKDKSPMGRFSASIYESEEQNNLATSTYNAILDMFFSSLTRNIFSFNIISIKDKGGVSIMLKPIKSFMLKLTSVVEKNNNDATGLELQYIPSQDTYLTFKTSDNGTETITGVEFQVRF